MIICSLLTEKVYIIELKLALRVCEILVKLWQIGQFLGSLRRDIFGE
jgi:hypothetical protein